MLTQQNLSLVVEGMEIYDRDGARIGTVKAFLKGEGTIQTNNADIVTIANTVMEALGGGKDLPTVLYRKLYDEGFVCVNRGFLRSDLIILPSQIDDIGSNEINLNVQKGDLIKI